MRRGRTPQVVTGSAPRGVAALSGCPTTYVLGHWLDVHLTQLPHIMVGRTQERARASLGEQHWVQAVGVGPLGLMMAWGGHMRHGTLGRLPHEEVV
jgi:hypothetical protein